MFIATFIAEGTFHAALPFDVAHEFDVDCTAGDLEGVRWIDEGYAFDLTFTPAAGFAHDQCAELAAAMKQRAWAISKGGYGDDIEFDVIAQPAANREKKLIVADMDSTMITVECIDELADYAGIKAEIADITEAAMRGELDFAQALDARVALLKGLDEGAIDRCLAERVRLMPGAATLIRTMKARGAYSVLVSGGFTRFADPVGAQIGFDRVIANRLNVVDGMLDGTVGKPIVDSSTKLETLETAMAEHGLGRGATLAVGDGANDLAMIRAAGLGVAYHAKPIVAAAAGARIDHGNLTALLWAQGIARKDWVVG